MLLAAIGVAYSMDCDVRWRLSSKECTIIANIPSSYPGMQGRLQVYLRCGGGGKIYIRVAAAEPIFGDC